ncbi:hypothetical protein [Burkholderia pseudomallei]|uniref:hypothetical protein n=1 Tax=Burkholderia pseudomallei TaxID=28450 RepID=UPI0004F78C2F|nr:hypothetical protein [Burkholderia pseudomallei]AIP70963.1 hypothetical protein DU27_1214 [Burkholderia pseudomallei]AJW90325.1 hypothetical protein BG92_141 [Burkholderia pseudomallei 406e]AYX07576.1 hypothetical protein EGY14_28690 [Burkholderia pseudomallei]OMR39788.1 hypothetical protein AQ725_21980 [Burkholderia pseudomallei]CAJ3956853.1 Uncharacterised protein [Burkholderia pseudomallei]
MEKPSRATIVFYDEDSEQIRMCTVLRKEVQAVIDREMARSGGMTIPPDAEPNDARPITDEDARKLGGIAILMQAGAHPKLRERLQITTAEPVTWTPIRPPGE